MTGEHRLLSQANVVIEGRDLIVTRMLKAPRELVFQTWTEPRHLANWWGPEGFSITIRSIEVKPGGIWDYVMHGPDGTDYVNRIRYVDVVRPERLDYIHGDDAADERFRVSVTMADRDGATELTMRMTFPSAEELQYTVEKYGAAEGAKSTLSRLAQALDAFDAATLKLTRAFDAPRELVFRAWTDPEHLKRWWGPKDFVLDVMAFDLRPDGAFHYRLTHPDGTVMWAKFRFLDIASPSKLVFVNSFSDAAGSVARAPFSAQYPLEVMNLVTFAEANGRTIVTMQSAPIYASEEEAEFFRSMHPSMQQGFGTAFDQLADHLAAM
ncbi:SRPBCC family protein [Paenibacillus sp.]|uniref:SRPBCC family protein n=1 Tax=Paenibacillus sp. TaxID=58172 RepID=UPI002D757CB6|nr:SRPBCC family protein [Paenibacillus sp.]HZG85628.1 SRPBCC family protein [Paenibacillus sp.]